jgi:tetratricopeptide (TPR) repeat protein
LAISNAYPEFCAIFRWRLHRGTKHSLSQAISAPRRLPQSRLLLHLAAPQGLGTEADPEKMLKFVTAFCAAIVSALGISTAHANAPSLQSQLLIVKAGDLIARKNESAWEAIKILAVDPWPDGSSAAHCLTYESSVSKPTVESLRSGRVRIWHAPIDARSFSNGWELIGNQAPSQEEFSGFIEYLKQTNFPRYIEFTGQDSKEIVRKANMHYKKAHALGDQGRRAEAITEYGKAIDLFPLFYEAIDNRAFTHMELGQIQEALEGFEASLRVNPSGLAAFFSRGECLMKLGHLKAAEAVFQEGQTKFPEKRALFSKFLDQVRTLKGNGQ